MAQLAGGITLDTKELDRLAQALDANAGRALAALAFQVEGHAKNFAPVDTGALKNSIQAEQRGTLAWWVRDGVEYGIYQEFGTYRMAAQPFMIPALERVQRDLPAVFAREITK